jgi:hypothetical protein
MNIQEVNKLHALASIWSGRAQTWRTNGANASKEGNEEMALRNYARAGIYEDCTNELLALLAHDIQITNEVEHESQSKPY